MIFNNANKFDDSEHETLMAIWWTGIMLRSEARKFFADKPASDTQFNVMMVLKYADHLLTQQELSRHLLVDQSNLTGLGGSHGKGRLSHPPKGGIRSTLLSFEADKQGARICRRG